MKAHHNIAPRSMAPAIKIHEDVCGGVIVMWDALIVVESNSAALIMPDLLLGKKAKNS
jgi:hypothetical protein